MYPYTSYNIGNNIYEWAYMLMLSSVAMKFEIFLLAIWLYCIVWTWEGLHSVFRQFKNRKTNNTRQTARHTNNWLKSLHKTFVAFDLYFLHLCITKKYLQTSGRKSTSNAETMASVTMTNTREAANFILSRYIL